LNYVTDLNVWINFRGFLEGVDTKDKRETKREIRARLKGFFYKRDLQREQRGSLQRRRDHLG